VAVYLAKRYRSHERGSLLPHSQKVGSKSCASTPSKSHAGLNGVSYLDGKCIIELSALSKMTNSARLPCSRTKEKGREDESAFLIMAVYLQ
jgi:hypothetical protein